MPFSTKPRNTQRNWRNTLKDIRGFTLLELLIVVAIIGALAAIAFPAYNSYVDKAKITVAYGTLDAMRKSFEGYHVEQNTYPPAPIDFVTGLDSSAPPRKVFSGLLLDQISSDVTISSYTSTSETYELIVNAIDSNLTQLTLTPTEITKAP